MWIKVKWGWKTLIPQNACPYKGAGLQRSLALCMHTEKRPLRTQWEGGCLPARKRGLTRKETSWHFDLGLLAFRNCEKIYFYYLRHPTCGILLWQPELMNNDYLAKISREPSESTRTSWKCHFSTHPTPVGSIRTAVVSSCQMPVYQWDVCMCVCVPKQSHTNSNTVVSTAIVNMNWALLHGTNSAKHFACIMS